MQTANILLALGGDKGNCVPKYGVTAAEIAVLRVIHGNEAVFDVEPTDQDAMTEVADGEPRLRTNREERSRLLQVYASGRVFGGDTHAVSLLYPGAAARVHEDIDELDLPEDAFKAERRVTAKPAKAEKPVKDKKASKTETPKGDGIEDMPDGKSAVFE